jgi:hypothetical protein
LADDAGFLKEARASLTLCDFRRKELKGNNAPDHRIVSANDTAGCACADSIENLVAADFHGDLPSANHLLAGTRIARGTVWRNETTVPKIHPLVLGRGSEHSTVKLL